MSSDNEEEDEPERKSVNDESQNDSESSSHSEVEQTRKARVKSTDSRKSRVNSTAESESTQDTSPEDEVVARNVKVEAKRSDKPDEQETVVSSSVTVKDEAMEYSDTEAKESHSPAKEEKTKKRRSIKRLNVEPDEDISVEPKKAKLEVDVKVKKEQKEKVAVKEERSSDKSDDDIDDIPVPEDELMLDLPEISKWEREDPYDLSPEPTRVKAKWKPEKQTFLPRYIFHHNFI